MSASHEVVRHFLASDVADSGTFLVGYPTGTDEGTFYLGTHHYIQSNKYGRMKDKVTASFSFGTTGVTITNSTGQTLEAGTEMYINLDKFGGDPMEMPAISRAHRVVEYLVDLGAPDTADVDGLIAAFTGDAEDIALDGALVSDGVGTFDVPRNIVVDSGGADTAVLTFTGTDEYGETVVESITLNGSTAVGGKKAFKTITGVTASAALSNGAFAGPGDVLGIPIFVRKTGLVVRELQDGAAATAGTVVAGVETLATATTGDVRGTYDPNAACDGDKVFHLSILTDDPNYLGVAQYAG